MENKIQQKEYTVIKEFSNELIRKGQKLKNKNKNNTKQPNKQTD